MALIEPKPSSMRHIQYSSSHLYSPQQGNTTKILLPRIGAKISMSDTVDADEEEACSELYMDDGWASASLPHRLTSETIFAISVCEKSNDVEPVHQDSYTRTVE